MNSDTEKPNVIVICGPTGIGKTSVAIQLAEHFNGQIVSADSMQIYRYMDIGTAKPDSDEQARIRHYMIDIVDPDEHFDAALFSKMANPAIKKLHNQGILPFIVGGTGLYIKALLHGLFEARPADRIIIDRLKKEEEKHGSGFLHNRLNECDPESAKKIHPNDSYRITRALEIFEVTGKPLSNFHKKHRFIDESFNSIKIGLFSDRTILYNRINKRVDSMIENGLIEEVKNLIATGYSTELKSMQSIGYRHIAEHLEENVLLDDTIRILKRDTRRYAKRQFTWFNADPEVRWNEPDKLDDIRFLIDGFLNLSKETPPK